MMERFPEQLSNVRVQFEALFKIVWVEFRITWEGKPSHFA